MMDDEKPKLVIIPRGRLDGSEGGIIWAYFLHTKKSYTFHSNITKHDESHWSYKQELIGMSRCGGSLEDAKKQAYKIMAGRDYSAYDYDVIIKELPKHK